MESPLIYVNGSATEIPNGQTFRELVEKQLGGSHPPRLEHVAVAVNNRFLPRADWQQKIAHGDRIEIVTPFQGG